MSVYRPDEQVAPQNPPSPDSATSDRIAAAIARAEAAEAELAMAITDADELRVAMRKAEAARAVAEEALRMIANPELSFMHEGREISENAITKIAALKGGAA